MESDSKEDVALALTASSGRKSRVRVTRATKAIEFMQLDSDMDSDAIDADSDDVAEDLALIAGAAENDDEEAADLEAAIQASLTQTPAGRGKTGAPSNSRAAMATLRALAAEKRTGTSQVVDDRRAWGSDEEVESLSSELSSDDLDSDEGAKKAKKGKTTATKKGKEKTKVVTVASTSKRTSMSLKEMRAIRRAEKEEARKMAAPVKHEELLLRKQLGRKLTHVRGILGVEFSSDAHNTREF